LRGDVSAAAAHGQIEDRERVHDLAVMPDPASFVAEFATTARYSSEKNSHAGSSRTSHSVLTTDRTPACSSA
jgi:hypothetical protein